MFSVEETHWWYRALHQLVFDTLEKELPNWRDKAILDAGCGTGLILQKLGNPAKNAGVDLAPEAIEFCHRRGLRNVQQADICNLPFTDSTFDVVISSSVLYHQWVKDIDGALHEVRRVLRPGGLLLVNVPAYKFLHSAHDDAVMTERRFRKNEIRQLLTGNGFEIRRITYWTTLLFPFAVAARTLGGSATGRDFQTSVNSLTHRLFGWVMALEPGLLRYLNFPWGVALWAIGEKPPR